MNKKSLSTLALLGLLLFALWLVLYLALRPNDHDSSVADSGNGKVKSALHDYPGVELSQDGDKYLLRGVAASTEERDQIEAAVRESGIENIDNWIHVGDAADGTAAATDAALAPYIGAAYSGSHIVLDGQVANADLKANIINDFTETFTGITIDDQIEVTDEVANPETFYVPATALHTRESFAQSGTLAARRAGDSAWRIASGADDASLALAVEPSVNSLTAAEDLVAHLRALPAPEAATVAQAPAEAPAETPAPAPAEETAETAIAGVAALAPTNDDKFEARHNALQDELEKVRMQLAGVAKERDDYKAQNGKVSAAAAAAAEAASIEEKNIAKKEAELEKLKAKLAAVAEERDTAKAAASKVNPEEVAELKTQIAGVAKERDEFKAAAHNAMGELEVAEKAATQAAALAKRAKADQEAATKLRKEMEAIKAETSKKLEEATEARDKAITAAAKTQSELSKLKEAQKAGAENAEGLRKKIAEYATSLSSLKGSEEKLELALTAQTGISTKLSAANKRVEELEAKLKAADADAKKALEGIEKQSSELGKLKSGIADRDATIADLTKKLDGASEEATSFEKKNVELAAKLKDASTSAKKENEAKAAADKARQDLEATIAQLRTAQKKDAAEMAAKLEAAEKELEEAQADARDSKAAEKELAKLRAANESIQKELQESSNNLSAAEKQTHNLELALGESAVNAGVLEKLIAQLNEREDELEDALGERKNLTVQAQSAKDRTAKLSEEAKAANAANASLQKELDRLTMSLKEQDAEYDAAMAKFKEEQEAASQELTALEKQIEELMAERENAEGRIKEMSAHGENAEKASARVKELEAQIAALNEDSAAQNEKLQGSLNSLQTRSSELEQAAEKAAAQALREAETRIKSEQGLADLKSRLTETEQELAKAKELTSKLTATEGKLAEVLKMSASVTQEKEAALADAMGASKARLAKEAEAADALAKAKAAEEAKAAAEKAEAEAIAQADASAKEKAKALADAEAANKERKAAMAAAEAAKKAQAEISAKREEAEAAQRKLENSLKKTLAQLDKEKKGRSGAEKDAARFKDMLARVDPVLYGLNSADNIAGQHQRVLEQVRSVNEVVPDAHYAIIGHTCDIGDDANNLALSERRAKSLADFLIANGVDANRIAHRGAGETEPTNRNDGDAERSANRRVMIMVGEGKLPKEAQAPTAAELEATAKKREAEAIAAKEKAEMDAAREIAKAGIEPVSYGLNSTSNVSGQHRRVLSQVEAVLKVNPEASFQIVGHTCDLGADDANLALSERRALQLANFLTENGIDTNKVSTKGAGESEPLNDNESDEDRRANRRVEVRVKK